MKMSGINKVVLVVRIQRTGVTASFARVSFSSDNESEV